MFDLHKLGWQRFQQLCLTITREILGQTVQSFLDSNDGGRDGAFVGSWTRRKAERLSGQFVVQCKFTAQPHRALRASELSDELSKAARLVKEHRCDAYVLMTNAGISGKTAGVIDSMLKNIGVRYPLCLGADWICQQIQESQRLRMMVPHVYGLGDLSQILDSRAYSQAQKLLAALHDDLPKVVLTRSYERAARALRRHGFVLLLGEPASGKTTVAATLAMAAIDRWKCLVMKLDNPNQVVEHWNPDEHSQFFWIDDAFGTTQYESTLAWGWNHIFAQVRAALTGGAKIVMTSRDYIYNGARRDLKESAFPMLRENQVVIDLHELTVAEKQQIIYNHIRIGNQPQRFRSRIKPHLERVALLEGFVPEVARRLGDRAFTRGLNISEREVTRFVEQKEQFLKEVLITFDADSKAALALIFMRNGNLPSPVTLTKAESAAVSRLGSDLGRSTTALSALNGSTVRYVVEDGSASWKFKHPTIGDAFAALLRDDPELMGIYLHATPIDELVYQVTCGDVGLENTVIVPRALFPLIRRKLSRSSISKYVRSAFLARRCDKAFLAEYISASREMLAGLVNPYPPLEGDACVELLMHLFELGLLPEEHRKTLVKQLCEYAVSGEDAYPIQNLRIRKIFRKSEFRMVLQLIRSELLPRLAQVRREWQDNHQEGDDPESHMEGFLSLLNSLEERFIEDNSIVGDIGIQRNLTMSWVSENTPVEGEPGPPPRLHSNRERNIPAPGSRSVFDDVDA